MGIASLVWSSPETTTIGENISTADIIASGTISGGSSSFSSSTVTGQTDLQGDVLDTTGNLTLADAVDITASTTGTLLTVVI